MYYTRMQYMGFSATLLAIAAGDEACAACNSTYVWRVGECCAARSGHRRHLEIGPHVVRMLTLTVVVESHRSLCQGTAGSSQDQSERAAQCQHWQSCWQIMLHLQPWAHVTAPPLIL
jgi:hypothetical protein